MNWVFWKRPRTRGSTDEERKHIEEDRMRLERARSDYKRATAISEEGRQLAEHGRHVRKQNGLGDAVAEALTARKEGHK